MPLRSFAEVVELPAGAELLQEYAWIAVFSTVPHAWSNFERAEWIDAVQHSRAALEDPDALSDDHAEQFLVALQNSDDPLMWRQLFLDVARLCRPLWRHIAMVDLTLFGTDGDEGWWLVGGTGERRLNSLLDLVDFPECTGDVRGLHLQVAEAVAAGKVTWKHTAALSGGNFAAGAVAGWFGAFGAVRTTTKGVMYLSDRIARVDETAHSCADLLMAAVFLVEHGESEAVHRIEQHLLDAHHEAGEQVVYARRRRHRGAEADVSGPLSDTRELKAAVDQLTAFSEDELSPIPHVPDAVGLPADAATWVMKRIGIKVRLVDASGAGRYIVMKENWMVTDQSVSSGSPVPDRIELQVLPITQ